jgi:hypothetical protein
LDDALACLRRAVRADDALQPAYHNLVVLYTRRSLAGKAMPKEAFDQARRTLAIGPESGELFRDLAFFYALAAKQDGSLTSKAIASVAQAVAYGVDPTVFRSDPVFAAMAQDPAFQKSLITTRAAHLRADAVRLIDPATEAR